MRSSCVKWQFLPKCFFFHLPLHILLTSLYSLKSCILSVVDIVVELQFHGAMNDILPDPNTDVSGEKTFADAKKQPKRSAER